VQIEVIMQRDMRCGGLGQYQLLLGGPGHAARRSTLPRERFRSLALLGHGAMSDLSLLSAQ
jgi:hypothetical protein